MQILRRYAVQPLRAAIGFTALLVVAIFLWSVCATALPGCAVLLLAFGYAIALLTGGGFFENLIITGQRVIDLTPRILNDLRAPHPPGYGPPGQFAPPPPPPPAPPPLVRDLAVAADPRTPPETLDYLVRTNPATLPYIAANPSTYPALLDWLATLDDPEINAALAQRGANRRGFQPPG